MAEVLPVSGAEDKQVKEYGRMVLWAMKHWAFIWKAAVGIGSLAWLTYSTIQTLKSEMKEVKKDVATIKEDVQEIKRAIIPSRGPK